MTVGGIPIGTLVGAIELEDRFSPALGRIDNLLGNFASRFDRFGDGIDLVGLRLERAGAQVTRLGYHISLLAVPIAVAGGAALKWAADFESLMVKTVNLAGVTESELGGLSRQVLELATQVGKSPTELARALYAITSVGIGGAQALEILERSAKASAIGMGDTEAIARALVAAIQTYGKENLTATHAADALLVAVKEGGAEASHFADTMGRVIATSKLVGVSFEETVASIATFTRLGVGADEAVTALRGTLTLLLRPAEQTRDMLKQIGTSIEDVRKRVRDVGLAQATIELINLAKKNEDAVGRIFPNVRALAGVLSNVNSQAEAYVKIVKDATEATNSIDDAFERVQKTATQKWNRFWAEIQVILVQAGERLLPSVERILEAMKPLLAFVEKLVVNFAKLPQPVQTTALAFAGFMIVAGPVLAWSGRLIEAIGLLVGSKGFQSLITALMSVSRWLPMVGEAAGTVALGFGRIASVLGGGGVVALVVALVGSVVLLIRHWGTLQQLHDKLINQLADIAKWLGEVIGTSVVFNGVGTKLVEIWNGVSSILSDIGSIIQSSFIIAWNKVVQVFEATVFLIKTTVITAFDGLLEKLTGLSSFTKGVLIPALQLIGGAIVSSLPGVREFIGVVDWLNKNVPGWSSKTGSWAEAARKAAAQSQMELGAQRSVLSGGASFTSSIALAPEFFTLDDRLDSLSKKSEFSLNNVTRGVHKFGDALGSAAQSATPFTDAVKNAEAALARLDARTMGELRFGASKFDQNEFIEKAMLIPAVQSAKVGAEALEMFYGRVKDEMREAERASIKFKNTMPPIKPETLREIAHEAQLLTVEMLKAFGDQARMKLSQKTAAWIENAQAITQSRRAIEDMQNSLKPDTLETRLDAITLQYKRLREDIPLTAEEGENFSERMVALADEEIQARNNVTEAWLRGNALTKADHEALANDLLKRAQMMSQDERFSVEERRNAWKDYFDFVDEGLRKQALGWRLHLSQLGQSLSALGGVLPGRAGELVSMSGAVVSNFGKMGEAAFEFSKKVKEAGGLANLTIAEISAHVIDMTTGILSSFFMITSFLEKLVTQQNLAARARKEGIEQRGGFQAFNAEVALAGGSTFALMNARSMEMVQQRFTELDRLISENNRRLQAYNLTWLDFGKNLRQIHIDQSVRTLLNDLRELTFRQGVSPEVAIRGMSGALNQLIVDAVKSGTRIPAAMQPILTQLIKMGELSEQAARALMGLGTEAIPTFQEISEAANRYGIELDKLGPKVEQIRITETAEQIIKDWKLLVSTVGADANIVMQGMKDEVQELVTAALTMGLVLPEGMKPIIQAMIEAGLLTDQFGNLLTDVSGIEFGKPIVAAIEELILKLDELIDKLNKTGDAGEDAGRRIHDGIGTGRFAVPRPPEEPPIGGAAAGGVVSAARIIPFPTWRGSHHSDTVPVLTAPQEMIINEAQQEALAARLSSSSGGGPVHLEQPIYMTIQSASIRRDDDIPALARALAAAMREEGEVRTVIGDEVVSIMVQRGQVRKTG